jgi:hypothetical protein
MAGISQDSAIPAAGAQRKHDFQCQEKANPP